LVKYTADGETAPGRVLNMSFGDDARKRQAQFRKNAKRRGSAGK
jgi:hypothetical protein